jgi:TolB protein
MKKLFAWIVLLFALLACNIGNSAPTPTTDLFATLSASTPVGGNPAAFTEPASAATFSPVLSTPVPPTPQAGASPTPLPKVPVKGRIVYTCQVFKSQDTSQVCIINADGTGFRRLTTEDAIQHYYPSLSPDGSSVVYAAYVKRNIFEIYEMDLASGKTKQLTRNLGSLSAPEISPDGKSIVFTTWSPNTDKSVVWLMDRSGKNADKISRFAGWDPTWSSDGQNILFVADVDGDTQLIRVRPNGKDMHRVGDLSYVGGRADWSPDGQWIVTYGGDPGNRQIYIANSEGFNARVISPAGGNAREPSFSPDGQWVAFTAYYDHSGDANGCEIYIMRTDGSDLRRVTDNDYCDSQPRWGP